MVAVKYSTLPNVLTQYLPGYQASENRENEEETEQEEQYETEVERKQVRIRSAPRLPSRERSQELLRKQAKERYARQYENWQEVKAIYRDEQTRDLRKKTSLQKQLITTQDNLHQIRQQELEEEREKIREAEKSARRAKTSELERICKESLDSDRQKLAELRAIRAGRRRNTNSSNNAAISPTIRFSPEDTTTSAPHQHKRAPRHRNKKTDDQALPHMQGRMHSDLSTHSSLASGPLHHISGPVPGSPLYESTAETTEDATTETNEEYDNFDEDNMTTIGSGASPSNRASSLPWHHQQLYRLYGKAAADEFLYPKFEDKKRNTKAPKKVNPRFRRQGVNAGDLWDELRNESRNKLLKEDAALSPELKGYRERVLSRIPGWKDCVKRDESVPDLHILMDQSRIRNAQDYKHKCEIMYRSSHMNEDKSRVLMFNNPPPDLNNWHGEESCSRYISSWEEMPSDVHSELSYKKWLPRQTAETPRGILSVKQKTDEEKVPAVEFRPISRQNTVPKLKFLTERESRCEGLFSARHRQAEETKNIPDAYTGERPQAQTAMASLGRPSNEKAGSRGASGSTSGRRSEPQPRAQSEIPNGGKYISEWQPLSLSALIEYKDNIRALGYGDFNLGKPTMWKIQTPTA